VSPEFGRKSRPEQVLPAAAGMSMKRSSNISLIVMSTLAFTATFAGGSAFLAWQGPTQSQSCTTAADGTQTCAPARSSSGFTRYFGFHSPIFSERTAAPASQLANTGPKLVSGAPAIRAVDDTARGGFGASARAAFRGSAAS
jgi:hypothetical protein